ncbi:hypothetical protein R4Z09_03790 [Niallia oryzisoli]|uniref:Uncharacterized protein n=1 Tax=Niallia oryzisoli TaxID=1737571 RepID=A0ABZ2CEG9_9BACI
MSTDKSENYEFFDCRMKKMKSYDLKGMQFDNQREWGVGRRLNFPSTSCRGV